MSARHTARCLNYESRNYSSEAINVYIGCMSFDIDSKKHALPIMLQYKQRDG